MFGPDGYKLSDEAERSIERRLSKEPKLAKAEMVGRAKRIDDARGRYVHFAKSTLPEQLRLDGLKIVIDCANGAAYHVAPDALWELGADVIPLGVRPDGTNINDQCGSTYPQALQETVVASGADIGLALDGDADRLIVVDETGKVIDGDQLMALIAIEHKRRGLLKGKAVVATVMSNLGLERRLKKERIELVRTQVGDRYVLEEMRARGLQCRRRAVGAHHPDRSRHDRRRTGGGPADPRRDGRQRQEGQRIAQPVRGRARNCSRTSATKRASRSTMPR